MRNSILAILALAIVVAACGKSAVFEGPSKSCAIVQAEEGAWITCPNQTPVLVAKGEKGDTGLNGQNGSPCVLTPVPLGTQLDCPGSPTQVISDGLNGTPGTTVQHVELCPSVSGGLFHEYLVKIDYVHPEGVIESSYYGVYASGTSIGMTKLWPGTWTTSDGRSCQFTITAIGELIQ